MKYFLIIGFLCVTIPVFTQPSDFILLKQRNKTIATYFSGSTITFTSNTGAAMEANITQIKNDTLFLREYIIRQVPTQLGVYILDTLGSYPHAYHYNQIYAIGRSGRHFDLSGSGAVLMGGGILLTVGSAIVYFADRNKFSPELMAAAVALGGLGYILSKQGNKGMVIGKKYSLVYVKATAKK